MNRARIRDLGVTIGKFPTGPLNAITDVPGVLVGQVTVIHDQPAVARTGITVIVPRDGQIGKDYAFSGFHSFNGCGEMTGIHWLAEAGLLTSAIALTNTRQLGMVHDALADYSFQHEEVGPYYLPVVAETFDGWLNDLDTLHLTPEHVAEAMQAARSGPVDEGNCGGGTGNISHEFKGGMGTSSRVVHGHSSPFTVAALVQCNYGERALFRVDGVPVGQEIGLDEVPGAWEMPPQGSSILVVLATDAPLLPDQCRRLARRAGIGLARTGGVGANTSGDLFLAFATGNHIPPGSDAPIRLENYLLPNQMDEFFEAGADTVEEAILNALTAAETMTGQSGHTAHAIPLDILQQVLRKYGRIH